MRFVPRVYSQVSVEVGPLGEPFAAKLAAMRVLDILFVVQLQMSFELFRGRWKGFPAKAAWIVFEIRMSHHVPVNQEGRCEGLQTYLAARIETMRVGYSFKITYVFQKDPHHQDLVLI